MATDPEKSSDKPVLNRHSVTIPLIGLVLTLFIAVMAIPLKDSLYCRVDPFGWCVQEVADQPPTPQPPAVAPPASPPPVADLVPVLPPMPTPPQPQVVQPVQRAWADSVAAYRKTVVRGREADFQQAVADQECRVKADQVARINGETVSNLVAVPERVNVDFRHPPFEGRTTILTMTVRCHATMVKPTAT